MYRKILHNKIVWFIFLAINISQIVIACGKNGANGSNGKNGGKSTIVGALSASCTAGSSLDSITVPSLVPSVLTANNITSLFCSFALNYSSYWAVGDFWSCGTAAPSLYSNYLAPALPAAVTFNWPADGNNLPGPATNSSGTTTSGESFYCSTACIAQYSDGTSAYVLLTGSGTCQ